MMRPKPASSLQKTYDECYLTCSTAVYFEGQNNEAEALRSWRSALETINYHNAYRLSSTFTPKTETEKALSYSIRQLESQCRERVDLLEALRVSRKEAQENNEGGESTGNSTPTPTSTHRRSSSSFLKGKFGSKSPSSNKVNGNNHNHHNTTLSGWIGEGTIPAVDYADLSKPPPLPGRPALQTRAGTEAIANNNNKNNVHRADSGSKSASAVRGQPDSPIKHESRSSSTERQAPMLSTLRNKDPKKQAKKKASPKRKGETRPAASRAAGLAWDNIYRSPSSDKTASDVALASSRHSFSSDGFRKDSQDPRAYSGDELTSRRNFDDPDDQIPTSHWRDPRASDKAIRRVPVKTPVTISSAAPGGGSSHSGSRHRSSSSASATKDVVPPRSSPKPSVKPKPAELRSSHSEVKGMGSVPGTSRSSRNPNTTSKPASRARVTPISTGRDYIPYSPQNRDDGGVSGSMHRMDISSQNPSPGRPQAKSRETPPSSDPESPGPRSTDPEDIEDDEQDEEDEIMDVLNRLPKGVDVMTARQILNDIVVRGDEVHWNDIAGLEGAKKALKEAVVYPFLRPDLFSGLREPAQGMLLFGPPGTGKTMLARAVATESKSTFFSVSASTLTSKWHGESEKLVRALFGLAKALAPSIIFVDEIDSLLSARSSGTENEASRRSKTEFLIQWSDLQRAAAGREQPGKESKKLGDPSRVLVLAATNMPWDIDEAARRRFVRRQYIPLPEHGVREQQIRKLLSHQVYELSNDDIEVLVQVTDGFSGSDITSLAKDAAMGPLRNLGEALLHTPMEHIRPIRFADFEASLYAIRPSVSRDGLKEYEEWAKNFGERGG